MSLEWKKREVEKEEGTFDWLLTMERRQDGRLTHVKKDMASFSKERKLEVLLIEDEKRSFPSNCTEVGPFFFVF